MPAASSFGGSVRTPTSAGRPAVTRYLPPVPVKASGAPAQSHSGNTFGTTGSAKRSTSTRTSVSSSYKIPFTARGLSPTGRALQQLESRILGSMSQMIEPLRPPAPPPPPQQLYGPQGGIYNNLFPRADSMPSRPSFGTPGHFTQTMPIPNVQRPAGMSLKTYQRLHGSAMRTRPSTTSFLA